MRTLLRSTSLRLALLFAGLFLASALVLLGVIWWNTAGYLDREIRAVIVSDTRAITDQVQNFGLAGAVRTVEQRAAVDPDQRTVFFLAAPSLQPIAGNLTAWPLQAAREPGWYEVELVRADKARHARLLHVVLPGDYHLLVGRDMTDRSAIRDLVINGLIWSALIGLALAAMGGLLIRRAVLRRIEAIGRTAAAIVSGDLGRRVPLRGSNDEFDELTATINRMLDQIQQLVEGIRNVSNVVAHDLRTPLAEIRARLEELGRTRPAADTAYSEIDAAVGDIDRLIGTFNALLRLAEIDSGMRRSGFRRVALAEVAEEVAELYGPIAESRQIGLDVALGPGETDGDPFLLAQAIGNLVDNALKFTPAGGHVALQLANGRITVADDGPGIAEQERPRVIERFYRGDASRGTAGLGLGLSLVASVARLHGGELRLEDNSPGLRAVLELPAAR